MFALPGLQITDECSSLGDNLQTYYSNLSAIAVVLTQLKLVNLINTDPDSQQYLRARFQNVLAFGQSWQLQTNRCCILALRSLLVNSPGLLSLNRTATCYFQPLKYRLSILLTQSLAWGHSEARTSPETVDFDSNPVAVVIPLLASQRVNLGDYKLLMQLPALDRSVAENWDYPPDRYAAPTC